MVISHSMPPSSVSMCTSRMPPTRGSRLADSLSSRAAASAPVTSNLAKAVRSAMPTRSRTPRTSAPTGSKAFERR